MGTERSRPPCQKLGYGEGCIINLHGDGVTIPVADRFDGIAFDTS